MICANCKKGEHKECPSQIGEYYETFVTGKNGDPPVNIKWTKHPTGLSKVSEANQRAGLCTCQHRVTRMANESC